ncbi:hypothetical protein WKW50_16480 [Ochrobactrum sp. GPK 3]
MSILFAGAEDIDFNFVGGAQSGFSHSGYIQTAYSRISLRDSNRLEAKVPFSTTDAWLHFCATIGTASGTTAYAMCGFWSTALGDACVTLFTGLDGPNAYFRVNDGTGTFINGSTFSFPKLSTPSEFDLHAKIDGLAVTVEFFSSGVLLHRETFSIMQTYTITNIRLSPGSNYVSWGWHYSQVIVADEPTVGWKLKTLGPAANGDLTEFTGTYADVDEVTLTTDDKISTGVSAQSTFTSTSWNIAAGFDVAGVVVASYASSDIAATISNMVRLSGENYEGDAEGLSIGWAGYRSLWATNPATAAKWQPADINGTLLQFGVRVTV